MQECTQLVERLSVRCLRWIPVCFWGPIQESGYTMEKRGAYNKEERGFEVSEEFPGGGGPSFSSHFERPDLVDAHDVHADK